MQADRSLRIVLAEDSVLLREGLAGLLRRFGHTVVARVGDAPALVAAVQEHDPDIVVTDVRMPPGFSDEGLRAAVTLRAAHPALPVLVLSQYVEQTYAAELLDTDPRHGRGAGVGYLLKDRVGEVEEFVDAVQRVAAGGTVIDPEVVRQLLGRRRDPIDRLTPREREVLALMAEGWSNAAIARTLVVTEAAVAKHIGSILTKLDLPRPRTTTAASGRCSPISAPSCSNPADGAASATCRRQGAPGARPPRRSTPGPSTQCPCGAATRER